MPNATVSLSSQALDFQNKSCEWNYSLEVSANDSISEPKWPMNPDWCVPLHFHLYTVRIQPGHIDLYLGYMHTRPSQYNLIYIYIYEKHLTIWAWQICVLRSSHNGWEARFPPYVSLSLSSRCRSVTEWWPPGVGARGRMAPSSDPHLITASAEKMYQIKTANQPTHRKQKGRKKKTTHNKYNLHTHTCVQSRQKD